MKKDYQIICLDSSDKPQQVATIEANSVSKAKEAGKRIAFMLNLRFHLAKPACQ
jgi:hypothetical protein